MFNVIINEFLHFIAVISAISLFGFCLFIGLLYYIDSTQTSDAVRHNYPVIGRFRSLFEHLGEFFRQYFFAMDREELPFNRAVRNWIYAAGKNQSLSSAFGSTHDLKKTGSIVFLNSAYPKLDNEVTVSPAKVIGANCPQPYAAQSYFNISAMSYGALSQVAVEALAAGAHKAKCWMNTGEGSISPYHLQANCDLVFQLGTALYGARNEQGDFCEKAFLEKVNHPQVKMIEIKLSQGAKPGKGGILPASKVTAQIAEIRGIAPGVESKSPNRHPLIDNDENLLAFVTRLKSLSGKPVGIKFVLGDKKWLDTLCQQIKQADPMLTPDFFTVDSGDGGTGAAPSPLMNYVGLPISKSLPLVLATLDKYQLRQRIAVIASGKLTTPSQVAWALAEGADFINSARGFMFALGCIQALKCHNNTCPTGITTHDKRRQGGLNPAKKSQRIFNYHQNIVASVEMIANACGLENARQFETSHFEIVGEKN